VSAPTVSCVIPVRDGEAFLAGALESVLGQTHPPDEVIVVDDSSTDRSATIARGYGPPVRVLAGRHDGPAGARNQGLDAARGDLLCFLDADDLWLPRKQERQLARFAARPELEMSLCICEMFWEEGLADEEERYRALGRHRGAHTFQTVMVRRSAFDRVGQVDPRRYYGDNVDWLARAADEGVVAEVLDEVLVRRRMHAASLTHVDPILEVYVDIVKAHLDRLRAAGLR
jgi:glycosyltransferase involved in cell wall biosynthesis